MARADVIGLDEVVQKLQVRWLKVQISTIGIGGQVSLWTGWISQPQHKKKQIQQTTFHFHNLKKEISWKLWELRPMRHHAGREGRRHQVTLCCQETTVHFSSTIDRVSVSPGIVRALRDGWRTINCSVFVTDERSVLSVCPAEGQSNMVAVRIRWVSVLRTHPHMYPTSSAPLEVESEKYVRDSVLFHTLQCDTHEYL